MNIKLFITTAAVSASITGHAFARNEAPVFHTETALDGETINAKVTDSFHSDFRGASGIWNVQGGFDEVLFVWHNQLAQSYYTKDGRLIGTYHRIDASALPVGALNKINSDYKDFQLKDASVVERPGQDCGYFATLTGEGRIVKLEISADGVVNVLN